LSGARWANGSGVDDNATEFLVQPYRGLLDEMDKAVNSGHPGMTPAATTTTVN
jgi:hypothetical protein